MENKITFDLEVSPTLAYLYRKHEGTALNEEKEYFIMSVSWQEDDGKIQCMTTDDFSRDRDNDGPLLKEFKKVWNPVDTAIGHNIQRFDIPVLRTRMAKNGLGALKPVRPDDTLKTLWREFKLFDNSLHGACKYFGLGGKTDHHSQIWEEYIKGKPMVKRLVKYNKNDVVLSKKLHTFLLPWSKNNVGVYFDRPVCTHCGSSRVWSEGLKYRTSVNAYRLFQCRDCKGYMRGLANLQEYKPLRNV